MSFSEQAEQFECGGESLVGIAALPTKPNPVGLVTLVGGPQYRVGSHRQFTLLCRRVASAGYPAFRFDYRGMGDSSGAYLDFEHVDAEVHAAISRLQAIAPHTRRVVLWGLCTAASTAMMYAANDPRVAGLVLLNPWVRDEVTSARTQVKHYYTARIAQREFWEKIAKGRFDYRHSLGSLTRSLMDSFRTIGGAGNSGDVPFQTRMAHGLRAFPGRSLLLLSGDDLVAKEFLECISSRPEWHGVLQSPRITRRDFPEADHTFSTSVWRNAVEDATIDWLAAV